MSSDEVKLVISFEILINECLNAEYNPAMVKAFNATYAYICENKENWENK